MKCEAFRTIKLDYPEIKIPCPKESIFEITIFSCLGDKKIKVCKKHMIILVTWLCKKEYEFKVRRIP